MFFGHRVMKTCPKKTLPTSTFFFLAFQLFYVAEVAIIHKAIEPSMAINKI